MSEQDSAVPPERSSETGIEMLDYEHKMIFATVSDFLTVSENELGERIVGQVLVVLQNCVKSHFEHEEEFMRDIDYDQFAEHAQVHEDFLNRLSAFCQSSDSGEEMRINIARLFVEFRQTHILNYDLRIAEFVNRME
ncbi:MAG: hemerythrin domain-containing protein [Rhodospirillaceae bacterium]